MPLTELNQENYTYLINELKSTDSWVTYQTGDILKRPDINMLIFQMNCQHVMNTGLAHKIKETYLEVLINDKKTTRANPSKLGSFSSSLVKNVNTQNDLLILTCYSQFNCGSCDVYSQYDTPDKRLVYLADCLQSIADFIKLYAFDANNQERFVIAVPWMIGCGHEGNDVNNTFFLFKKIFEPLKQYALIMFVDINEKG